MAVAAARENTAVAVTDRIQSENVSSIASRLNEGLRYEELLI